MPFLHALSRSPLRYVAKAHRLRPSDVRLVSRMLYLLGKLLALRSRRPLPELIAAFDAEPETEPVPKRDIQRLVRLVDALMQTTFRDEYCMKRSLLLFHFLRRWGHDVRIHFGVVKREGSLKGHAWVDLNEAPLAEFEDPRTIYARTYSYPPLPERTPQPRS